MWPLVGRDSELRFATDALDRDDLLVVAGEGGVGKTRLLSAVADWAESSGRTVVHGIGTRAARGIPLAALAHLLPRSTDDVTRDEVLARIVDALAEEAPVRRRLIIVDDAHLLDDASATLVGLLSQADSVAVAVGVRSGEPCPDPVVALWKDRGALRLELQPLSEVEAERLLREILGGAVDRATVRMLWSSTDGNVLFLRELVIEGLAQDVLRQDSQWWRWHGPPVVSPSLRELIAARLAGLDDASRTALELISVAEPVGSNVVDQLISPDVLDNLEREGLVKVATTGGQRTVRVGHPLYGEALRSDLPHRRAGRLRSRVADAIEAGGSTQPEDVLRVAALRLDAGAEADPEVLVAAARWAWTLNDATLVERLASAALKAGPNPEASYLIGETMAHKGQHDEAVALWEEVLASDCDDDLRARVAMSAASTLALTAYRREHATSLLRAAEEQVASPDARQRIEAFRTALFLNRMSNEAVRQATSPLLEATAVADEARVWAWTASARQRMVHGELDSVLAESEEIDEFADRAGADWPLAARIVSFCRYFALLLAGRLDDAEELASRNLEQTLDDPLPIPRVHWTDALGLVALTRGHLDRAAGYLSEAVDVLRVNNNGVLHVALAELAMIRAWQGDALAAEAARRESVESDQSVIGQSISRERVAANILAAAGQVDEARQLIGVQADEWAELNQPFHEVPALHDLARFGGAAQAAPRLAKFCETYEGPVVVAYADQAAALADHDGTALSEVATRFAVLGYDLDAAESEAAATAAFRAVGQPSKAAAAARRAGEHLGRCGGARTPLLSSLTALVALTAREEEVASMVARGSTDAQVAHHLAISRRTVHAHLRSVYAKLGVANRQDLADVIDARA